MNVHPVFVHFPIALLTLYSVMEILQFRRIRNMRSWRIVKSVFLLTGTLGTFIALITGDMAQELLGANTLIETHSTYATITTIVFVVLSVLYFIRLVNTEQVKLKDLLWNKRYVRTIWELLSRISDFIMGKWWFLLVLGIIGLILITITGALGGAIAYGPDVDPVVSFVYHLFF